MSFFYKDSQTSSIVIQGSEKPTQKHPVLLKVGPRNSIASLLLYYVAQSNRPMDWSWILMVHGWAEGMMGTVMCGRKVDELFLFGINYYSNINPRYII